MVSDHEFSKLVPIAVKPLPTEMPQLQHEVLRLRDEVIGLRALLAEAEVVVKSRSEHDAIRYKDQASDHIEYLQGVVADLEDQLEAIRVSSTWRLGRALLLPVRLFKRS